MRFLTTLFWTLLLTNMLGYVTSSMTPDSHFDFKLCSVIAVIATVLIAIVGETLGKEQVENTQH